MSKLNAEKILESSGKLALLTLISWDSSNASYSQDGFCCFASWDEELRLLL